MAHRCLKPQCPPDCSECNHALPDDDEAAMLVCDLLDAFAVDGFDGSLEDGESQLVDRARAWLATRRSATLQKLPTCTKSQTGDVARPPTPIGWSDTDWIKHLQEHQNAAHPLAGQHINQGSMDAAADAYEAEYKAAHVTPAIDDGCYHDWENGEDGNPERCSKCGLSFTRFVHSCCP